MSAVHRYSLAEQVADAVDRRIAAGEWSRGARIPGEAALAAEFGVGRSTVREAVRQLAGRGILQARQGSGVFVSDAEPALDWDQLVRRCAVADAVEGRIAIEVESARLAASRRTPRDLERIERALSRRAEATAGDADAFLVADAAFHRAVVAAAHNEVLLGLFDGLGPRVHDAMAEVMRVRAAHARSEDTQADHAEIVAAIRSGDPDEAAASSRRHLVGLMRTLR